jgi:hypothetical protein
MPSVAFSKFGVFAEQKLHLKHQYTAFLGGKER